MRTLNRILSAVFVVLLCLVTAIPALASSGIEITRQPQNATYPEGSVASYSVEATGNNLHYTWFIIYEGVIYDTSRVSAGIERQPWDNYLAEGFSLSESGNTFYFDGILAGISGAQIYCEISNGVTTVKSSPAYITVEGSALPPEIVVPASMTVTAGTPVDLYCAAKTYDASTVSYLWYESITSDLNDIIAIDRGAETADTLHCETDKVGTRYYACMVTTSTGGRSYSNVIPVTVLEKPAEVVTDTPTQAVTDPVTEAPTTAVEADPSASPEQTTGPDTQNGDATSGPSRFSGVVWWVVVIIVLVAVALGCGVGLLLVLHKSKKQ